MVQNKKHHTQNKTVDICCVKNVEGKKSKLYGTESVAIFFSSFTHILCIIVLKYKCCQNSHAVELK